MTVPTHEVLFNEFGDFDPGPDSEDELPWDFEAKYPLPNDETTDNNEDTE